MCNPWPQGSAVVASVVDASRASPKSSPIRQSAEDMATSAEALRLAVGGTISRAQQQRACGLFGARCGRPCRSVASGPQQARAFVAVRSIGRQQGAAHQPAGSASRAINATVVMFPANMSSPGENHTRKPGETGRPFFFDFRRRMYRQAAASKVLTVSAEGSRAGSYPASTSTRKRRSGRYASPPEARISASIRRTSISVCEDISHRLGFCKPAGISASDVARLVY
jgi:hypothetical protein